MSAIELERKMLKLFKKELRQTQTRLKRLKLNIAYSEKLIRQLRKGTQESCQTEESQDLIRS